MSLIPHLFITLIFITLMSFIPMDFAQSQTTCAVYCPDGSQPIVSCDATYDPCDSGDSGGSYESTPSYDYEAAQRALEAEQERQRQEEELARQRQEELDNQRLLVEERRQQEEAERQAKLIRDQQEFANSLKGINNSDTQLKSSSQTTIPSNKVSTVNTKQQEEIKRLVAKEQELPLSIEKDMKAIKNLGFDRADSYYGTPLHLCRTVPSNVVDTLRLAPCCTSHWTMARFPERAAYSITVLLSSLLSTLSVAVISAPARVWNIFDNRTHTGQTE